MKNAALAALATVKASINAVGGVDGASVNSHAHLAHALHKANLKGYRGNYIWHWCVRLASQVG